MVLEDLPNQCALYNNLKINNILHCKYEFQTNCCCIGKLTSSVPSLPRLDRYVFVECHLAGDKAIFPLVLYIRK